MPVILEEKPLTTGMSVDLNDTLLFFDVVAIGI